MSHYWTKWFYFDLSWMCGGRNLMEWVSLITGVMIGVTIASIVYVVVIHCGIEIEIGK